MFVYGVTPLCSSLHDDHKRSKRNTDSMDATDLFIHGFLFSIVSDCMRLLGAWILTDLPQLEESSAVQAQENQYQIQKQ